MTLLSSLTNRIFLASAMLAIATTGVAIYVVGTRVTREADVELQRGLADAGSLVAQQQRTLVTNYALFARLIADLPKLKSAVSTQDPITVQPIAVEYLQNIGADLLVITGRTGVVLARSGESALDPSAATVRRALSGQEALEFRPDPAGILQIITVPISIGLAEPDLLGTLSLGIRLDEQRATQFKRGTHSEIAFVLDGRVRAATLPAVDVAGSGDARGRIDREPDGGNRRICWSVPAAATVVRSWSGADRRRRRGGAGPAVADRAAPVPSHGQHGAGRRRVRRRAARNGSELRRRANGHAPARHDHRHDARSGDDRRPDAKDHAARTGARSRTRMRAFSPTPSTR